MKNVPTTIYLQVGEDCPDDVDFDMLKWGEAVTWCEDKINDTDIEYVLKVGD